MAIVLVIYLVAVAQTAIRLISTEEPVAIAMGISLIVLPILGAWGLFAELRFGWKSERLAKELIATNNFPLGNLPRLPSGRIEKEAALSVFDNFKKEAEQDPQKWQSWYRLGLAYDACGDRRRARSSIRNAIRLHDSVSGNR